MSAAVRPLTVPRELLGAPVAFNPTLLIFLVAVGIAIVSNIGYWCWHWVDWCCFTLNVLALHLSGTVIHDACHNVAHRNRIVNAIMGHVSALLLAFSFPVFTRVHLQHHAHVNHPKDDPDHYVSTGGPLLLIAARFLYHEVFFFKRQLWRKWELLEWFIARAIVIGIFWVGIQNGFLGYLLNFWGIPSAIVGVTLGLFFDYLPHRPHFSRDRWTNARVYPNRVLNWLIMGQNYHLIHHLWPSIPWYSYERAYGMMKPLLDQKGSPQTLGLLEGHNFWRFLYDVFIGIHWHHDSVEETAVAEPTIDPAESDEAAIAPATVEAH